jgi:FG-GAP-like repeat
MRCCRTTMERSPVWDINGWTIGQFGLVPNPCANWHIEGTGDFNDDGHTDVLLQNNDGSVAIWEMTGQVSHGIVVANPGPDWHIASTGDFNQDGMTDITLQNNNGSVAVWDMDGSHVLNASVLANPGPAWSVTGDGRHIGEFIAPRSGGARGDASHAGRVGVHQLRGRSARVLRRHCRRFRACLAAPRPSRQPSTGPIMLQPEAIRAQTQRI